MVDFGKFQNLDSWGKKHNSIKKHYAIEFTVKKEPLSLQKYENCSLQEICHSTSSHKIPTAPKATALKHLAASS